MTSTVSFEVSAEDRETARLIAERAVEIAEEDGHSLDFLSTFMDLIATHANGCPLDLQRLLEADDFNLAHDVFGIARHINRETGELEGFFSPRFSVPETDEVAA